MLYVSLRSKGGTQSLHTRDDKYKTVGGGLGEKLGAGLVVLLERVVEGRLPDLVLRVRVGARREESLDNGAPHVLIKNRYWI